MKDAAVVVAHAVVRGVSDVGDLARFGPGHHHRPLRGSCLVLRNCHVAGEVSSAFQWVNSASQAALALDVLDATV